MALTAEYWNGYREAKIHALLLGLEEIGKLNEASKLDNENRQYAAGYKKGLASLETKLARMLKEEGIKDDKQ